jgi:hypothetical protein
MRLPSGLNATEVTPPGCHLRENRRDIQGFFSDVSKKN